MVKKRKYSKKSNLKSDVRYCTPSELLIYGFCPNSASDNSETRRLKILL